jgi:hypothetical protein
MMVDGGGESEFARAIWSRSVPTAVLRSRHDALRCCSCGKAASVIHLMKMAGFFMDNRHYPPTIRKPVRDNHFAVTWGQGRSVTVTNWLCVYPHRHRRSSRAIGEAGTHVRSLAVEDRRDLAAEVPQCAAWLAGRQR